MSIQPDVRRYPFTQEMPTDTIPSVQALMAPSETTMAIPAAAPVRSPFLTVWAGSSQHTFTPGRDILIGRDPEADVQVASPLVSRVHLVLRFVAGHWVATDNDSLNGVFVNGRRVSSVAVGDGQRINIGEPGGPALSFGFGRHTRRAEAPPTAPVVLPRIHPSTQRATTRRLPVPKPQSNFGSAPMQPSRRRASVPGAITVGRTPDNDVAVADVLASRHHAMLVPAPGGMEIHDGGTLNGTFVNGVRVEAAPLHEGDVVTIGNVDLVFSGGTLVGRCQTDTAASTGGLQVQGATLAIEQGRILLKNIAFAARPGTLTAVIGPSGAGKSTLAKLIAGTTLPTQGRVSFEGHDIHAAYASLRSRIGLVPQDDVVHSRLTVDQALNYAAELRLPPDTAKEDRRQIVAQVLEELELTPHANTRVDKLSGGQRKRASVAMELLTGPSLLILDEPTSGLDPALDRQVMSMLRKLADAGRVVIVVTHSLTYLNVCDQVVLLAPGGKMAYAGSPADVGTAMGTTDWADIFSEVAANPDAAHERYLAQAGPSPAPAEAEKPVDLGKPVQTSLRRQFSTIARRQLRLIFSDRGYFIFLVLLPFILGALSLAVPGNVGFGIPNPMGSAPDEPSEILVLLNIGAVFMGIALTIRDLIGERPIFRREQAVGLSTSAYLLAKVVVYCSAAVLGSAVMVGIVLFGKNGPTRGAVLLHNAPFELFVTVAATCIASVILGLALSALARSNEQIMPLLVVAIMAQLVLSGGLLPVAARLGLDQLSWVTPARWGHAAAASTVDLRVLEPDPGPQDVHWAHMPGAWLFDMAMLAVLCLVYGSFVRWKLRLKAS
jgi:ABC-type multidrug transport system ATPase subunit/pSer/pThr/pTyr-binding forkhead associated (FHA) protein